MTALKIVIGLAILGTVFWFSAIYRAENPWPFSVISIAAAIFAIALIANATGVEMPWAVIESFFSNKQK